MKTKMKCASYMKCNSSLTILNLYLFETPESQRLVHCTMTKSEKELKVKRKVVPVQVIPSPFLQ